MYNSKKCCYVVVLVFQEKKKMDHVRQQMLASDNPQDIHAQPHADGIPSSQQVTTGDTR